MKKLLTFDLNFDPDIVVITVASTLLLTLDEYHNFTGFRELDGLFIYLLIPLLIIWFVHRKSPKDFGLQIGDWKTGLGLTGLVILVCIPILWFTAKGDESMQKYYSSRLGPALPLLAFIDLLSWEFFFRGWILFGYARKFGDNALWLQAVPFAIAHFGKPEIETISTIFGGFLFGLVAWRSGSFIYAFLIHLFVNIFTILVAGGAFG